MTCGPGRKFGNHVEIEKSYHIQVRGDLSGLWTEMFGAKTWTLKDARAMKRGLKAVEPYKEYRIVKRLHSETVIG